MSDNVANTGGAAPDHRGPVHPYPPGQWESRRLVRVRPVRRLIFFALNQLRAVCSFLRVGGGVSAAECPVGA